MTTTIDDTQADNNNLGDDYFKNLLETVRSIRSNEPEIWLQITKIFVECSTDSDQHEKIGHTYFPQIQNKLLYAITEKTAGEIVYDSADAQQKHMGLQSWNKSSDNSFKPKEIMIAKNYFTENQTKDLEQIVSNYLDYLEELIEKKETFTVDKFVNTIDKFLTLHKYKILDNKGNISKEVAERKAYMEFNIWCIRGEIFLAFEKLKKRKVKLKKFRKIITKYLTKYQSVLVNHTSILHKGASVKAFNTYTSFRVSIIMSVYIYELKHKILTFDEFKKCANHFLDQYDEKLGDTKDVILTKIAQDQPLEIIKKEKE